MKPVNTYSSSPVKPSISSFTGPERHTPRGYLDAARTRPPMNQVRRNHASGKHNKRHESKGIADASDSQEEGSDEEKDNSNRWRRPPVSVQISANRTSITSRDGP